MNCSFNVKWTISPFSNSKVISTSSNNIDTVQAIKYSIQFIDYGNNRFIIVKNNMINDEIIDSVNIFSQNGDSITFHTVKYGLYFTTPYDTSDLVGQLDQLFKLEQSMREIKFQAITTIPSVSLTYIAYLSVMGTMHKTFSDIGKMLKREIKIVSINSYTIKFMINGSFVQFLKFGDINLHPSSKQIYFTYSNKGFDYGLLFVNKNGIFIGSPGGNNYYNHFDNNYITPLQISYTESPDYDSWINFFKFITRGVI